MNSHFNAPEPSLSTVVVHCGPETARRTPPPLFQAPPCRLISCRSTRCQTALGNKGGGGGGGGGGRPAPGSDEAHMPARRRQGDRGGDGRIEAHRLDDHIRPEGSSVQIRGQHAIGRSRLCGEVQLLGRHIDRENARRPHHPQPLDRERPIGPHPTTPPVCPTVSPPAFQIA